MTQLTLDGSEPRRPRSLTQRQRALVLDVRHCNDQAGAYPATRAYAHYRDPYGALRRLEVIGLLRRETKGCRWWAT